MSRRTRCSTPRASSCRRPCRMRSRTRSGTSCRATRCLFTDVTYVTYAIIRNNPRDQVPRTPDSTELSENRLAPSGRKHGGHGAASYAFAPGSRGGVAIRSTMRAPRRRQPGLTDVCNVCNVCNARSTRRAPRRWQPSRTWRRSTRPSKPSAIRPRSSRCFANHVTDV